MSKLIKRIKSFGPVVGAGLSFLVYAAILLPLGKTLHSSVVMAEGMDSANDGVFFMIGGFASWYFRRSHHHWLHCYAKESLEVIAMMFGMASYTVGIVLVPSTEVSVQQLIVGVIFGPLGVALNWYWHPRVKSDGFGHEGFSWHLLADLLAAAALLPCGILAYLTGWPGVNFWGAIVVLVATAWLCVRPARDVLTRAWHHPAQHTCPVHPEPTIPREGSA